MSDTDIDQQTSKSTETKSMTEAESVVETESSAEAESTAGADAGAPARTEQPVPDEPAGRGASRTRRIVTVVLAALVLAGVVVVGLLGWRAFTEWRAQGDREAALEAARSGTAAVLTYSSKTL
ncbi:MAG: hypothetical protein J2P19_11905, partial [Pseudonocardia sp.]|nr:hypothetical protein [Pseudonocardia sp.]